MQTRRIGEIARLAGVSPSTIRYYEEIGVLSPAERASGQRRYGNDVLKKLNLIRLAKRAGFSIAEIKTLLHDFPAGTPASQRWQTLAQAKVVELDEKIKHIQQMKTVLQTTLGCRCPTLDDCGDLIKETVNEKRNI